MKASTEHAVPYPSFGCGSGACDLDSQSFQALDLHH